MISSALGSEESLTYAGHFLAPLYKVSEGFAGKVVGGMIPPPLPPLLVTFIHFQHI
jgi:hypothetical protein